jgi:hypothetical protein
VDAELREAFTTLGAQVSDAAKDARDAASSAREANHRAARLEKHVFGSNPPPDSNPDNGQSSPALVKRVTSSEHADQELRARIERVEKLNLRQCAAMGVSAEETPSSRASLWTFLRSREAMNLALRVAVVLATAYGARTAIQARDTADHADQAVRASPLSTSGPSPK